VNKTTVRQIIVLVAVLATIVVNGLATTLPLNGLDTGEISDQFEIYFVPAGYVFSIWGVIYLGLIAFAVWQVLPNQAENDRLRRVWPLVALSCVANISWLFLWHYEVFAWTLPVMVVLLLSLIGVYLGLGIRKGEASTVERWVSHVTFSVYLGWVTVATIANATQVLYWAGWGGWSIGPQVWAVIMLAAATAIGWLMSLTRGDAAYLLVLVWAFIGISMKHASVPLVSISAGVAAGMVLAALVVGLVYRRRLREPSCP
jgi:hypothetical protein